MSTEIIIFNTNLSSARQTAAALRSTGALVTTTLAHILITPVVQVAHTSERPESPVDDRHGVGERPGQAELD